MTIRHILCLATCLLLLSVVQAFPLDSGKPPLPFVKRGQLISYDDSGKIVNVTDTSTGTIITQGSASDGGGTGFNTPAIIWLAWSFVIGAYLTLAGFSLWRPTTGAAMGIAGVVCVWASLVNTLNAEGIPDLTLTIIVMGAFVCGFMIGAVELGRIAGITLLGTLAGFSIGVRVVLFRANLLIPIFYVNWVFITVFGLLGLLMVMLSHRIAIITSAVSIGTFLISLGVDLVVNKQAGMSQGLRYLFDRNPAHIQDIIGKGYRPPVITIVLLALSLAAIPMFAYGQNLVFKQPFRRRRVYSLASTGSMDSDEAEAVDTVTISSTATDSEKLVADTSADSMVTLSSSAASSKSQKLTSLESSEKQ